MKNFMKIYKSPEESGLLIVSNEKMKDFIKIYRSPEESGLLIKGVSEIIKTKEKEQKCGCFSMSIGTLGATLLVTLLTGKRLKAKMSGLGVIRAEERTIKASQDFWFHFIL